MASLNFVKQIKARKAGAAAEAGGATGLAGRFAALTGGLSLEPREKVMLIISVISISSIYLARYALDEYYFKPEIAAIDSDIQKTQGEINELDKKLASYKALQAEIKSYDQKMAELREKLAVIDTVQKGRNSVVRMVDFLVTELPESVWLSKVSIDASSGASGSGSDRGKVDIKGYATNLQLVSMYMQRLEGAVFFPRWELIETTKEESGANKNLPSDAKSFNITARVVPL